MFSFLRQGISILCNIAAEYKVSRRDLVNSNIFKLVSKMIRLDSLCSNIESNVDVLQLLDNMTQGLDQICLRQIDEHLV